jgi:hypothetical protein
MLSKDSPIPTDIKVDIARCVRSVSWPSCGQDCCGRAGLGAWTLYQLGLDSAITFGSLIYRAGLDPSRDVCAFGDASNTGRVSENYFLGHVWIEMGGEIIDFTSGDWDTIKATDADFYPTGLGEVVWSAPPPEFIWANAALLKRDWKPIGAPDPGQCWYGPFEGEAPTLDDTLAAILPLAQDHLIGNLTAMNLFERCRRLIDCGLGHQCAA